MYYNNKIYKGDKNKMTKKEINSILKFSLFQELQKAKKRINKLKKERSLFRKGGK